MIENPASVKRILVVEDVQETRDAIEELLKTDGYSVDPARDEADAVKRIRWAPPDLILISLGGTSEEVLTTARRIRARAALKQDTPIVIFSLSIIPEGTEQEIDGNIHVTVPDNFNQLRSLLTRVLQSASRRQ
jgi:CheY-like chemotaxis protein